jgi:hypothetical protein
MELPEEIIKCVERKGAGGQPSGYNALERIQELVASKEERASLQDRRYSHATGQKMASVEHHNVLPGNDIS